MPASEGDGVPNDDTSRATVTTYVPAYQKKRWRVHAEKLEMTQSEFVRTMVQAGRRKFEVPAGGESGPATEAPTSMENRDDPSDDPDSGLEERVAAVLSEDDHLSWDELVGRLTADIEDRLDETLQRLQAENRVRYSGRRGGYALAGGADGE